MGIRTLLVVMVSCFFATCFSMSSESSWRLFSLNLLKMQGNAGELKTIICDARYSVFISKSLVDRFNVLKNQLVEILKNNKAVKKKIVKVGVFVTEANGDARLNFHLPDKSFVSIAFHDDVKHLFVDENLVIVDNKIFYSDVNNARDWEKVSCIEKRFPPNDKVTQGKEKGPFYHLF